jgi:hypothetical protein
VDLTIAVPTVRTADQLYSVCVERLSFPLVLRSRRQDTASNNTQLLARYLIHNPDTRTIPRWTSHLGVLEIANQAIHMPPLPIPGEDLIHDEQFQLLEPPHAYEDIDVDVAKVHGVLDVDGHALDGRHLGVLDVPEQAVLAQDRVVVEGDVDVGRGPIRLEGGRVGQEALEAGLAAGVEQCRHWGVREEGLCEAARADELLAHARHLYHSGDGEGEVPHLDPQLGRELGE